MLKSRIFGFLIALFFFPLRCSWRFRYFTFLDGRLEPVKKRQNLPPARCMALLHGQQLPLVGFSPYKKLAAMASRSKDGEIAATLLKIMGITPLRGSSHKGGREALALAVQHLQNGGEVAITVDGPRGPRGSCKRGIVELAGSCGIPIQPLAALTTQCWQLKSWDHFIIPYPLATIRIIYGEQMAVAPNLDDKEIFEKCAELSATLQKLEEL